MAIDAYMAFMDYNGNYLDSESQVDLSPNKSDLLVQADLAKLPTMQTTGGEIKSFGKVFEVEDYSFDIEQTLNIGSQGGGTGAGRISFNPFSITRKIDVSSPVLFEMACSGRSFKLVTLALRKSSGTEGAGSFFLRFDFKMAAVKTISWAHDDESPKETTTFEYGAMMIQYLAQNPNGKMYTKVIPGGWNRVTNKQDHTTTAI